MEPVCYVRFKASFLQVGKVSQRLIVLNRQKSYFYRFYYSKISIRCDNSFNETLKRQLQPTSLSNMMN